MTKERFWSLLFDQILDFCTLKVTSTEMMKPSLATFLSEVINLKSMIEGAELVGG